MATEIGYCISCENLLCPSPEIKKKNGDCSEWRTAETTQFIKKIKTDHVDKIKD